MRKFSICLGIQALLLIFTVAVVEAQTGSSASGQTAPAVQAGTLCDPNFVGDSFTFNFPDAKLDDVLAEIHNRFGVNFSYGPDVAKVAVNIRVEQVPWGLLLRTQLAENAIEATCSGDKFVNLAVSFFLKSQKRTDSTRSEFIKLKYLQPLSSGSVDIAGRGGSGGGQEGCPSIGGGSGGGSGGSAGQNTSNFCKLIDTINQILGVVVLATSERQGGEKQRPEEQEAGNFNNKTQVEQERVPPLIKGAIPIPGRNMLLVRGATPEQMATIKEVIAKVDRPPFQVVVKGLVYTANENKSLDVGVQSGIIASTGALRSPGQGSTGATSGTGSGTGTGGGSSSSGTTPPVRSVGVGYQSPTPGNLFDVLALIGTVDFNLQANALATKGIISVKSRPFAMVLDGEESELNIGRQIPVIIQAQNSIGTGAPGELQILAASNILKIKPYVLDNDNGEPVGVNLGLRFESNDVDLSVTSQGVPSINRQSLQTNLMLSQDKTIILGGFTVDSDSDSKSKVPGLGDLPGLGWLFKRRVKSNQMNRLYFAISVSVVPFGSVIEPVKVPDATTEIPAPAVKK